MTYLKGKASKNSSFNLIQQNISDTVCLYDTMLAKWERKRLERPKLCPQVTRSLVRGMRERITEQSKKNVLLSGD